MASEWFLDSSYAIALAATTDQLHEPALSLAGEIEKQSKHLITTRAVLIEVGNALSKQRYRAAANQLLSSLETDPTVTIVEITRELYRQGVELFVKRPDKEWGLTDCMSFLVMQAQAITDALTADIHFEQAGFRVLLRHM